MMRKFWLIFLTAFLSLALHAQDSDSLQIAALDGKLEAYFSALEAESVEVKKKECDFLLSSCTTDKVRNHVAVRLYSHFMGSKLMGDEAVAIYLTDSWFAPGKAAFNDELDLMNAKIFAEFNRQSLIGCRAPELTAVDTLGNSVKVPLGLSDRYRILYIYAPDCAVCKVQTRLLGQLFSKKSYPVDFIAFNSGDDAKAWAEARRSLDFACDDMRVLHFSDPSMESDFQRKYGVLQTPRMFLIDKNGIIVGRGLDALALGRMLDSARDLGQTYGSESSESYFDMVMESLGKELNADDIKYFAGKLGEVTLHAADTAGFRQMAGDMLYYLAGKRGEAYKEAELYVADSLILARPDIWRFPDDSMNVVGMAENLRGMLSLAPVGSGIPDLKVHGTLLRAGKTPLPVYKKLRRILRKKTNYVIFHTAGCSVCDAELAAAEKLSADRDVNILLVGMDEIMASYPGEGEKLLESFDLSVLPFILETDRKGRVVRKYLNLDK